MERLLEPGASEQKSYTPTVACLGGGIRLAVKETNSGVVTIHVLVFTPKTLAG